MREAKGAAPFVPTISEGIAQPARADASHASGRRCESSCPHHFSPCGVVQSNTPASHAGDHRSEAGQGRQFSSARGLRGKADPPDSESGSLGRASRLASTIFTAPKALSAMHSPGTRVQPGATPGGGSSSQSGQRSSRFHKPALPRAALGIATIFQACKH